MPLSTQQCKGQRKYMISNIEVMPQFILTVVHLLVVCDNVDIVLRYN